LAYDRPDSTVTRLGGVERLLLETTDRLATFSTQEFLDLVLDDLAWEGVDEGVRVLSLDVFDTILVRNDRSELRRFWQIAQCQADTAGVDARDLLVSRLTATRASYRASASAAGYREGEIEDIHRTALHLLGLDEELASAMVDQELAYESRNLTLNPAIEPLVKLLETDVVVAVSNMYLRAVHISRLLTAASSGLTTGGATCRVYSSTEEGMSKNDGRLLARAQADIDLPASAFLHIGDSYTSDFVPAKRLGWFAQLWPVSQDSLARRRADAVACIEELEGQGVVLGSLGTHFVEHP
jgi:FMN phosphatase YigB (HAD superfamily)